VRGLGQGIESPTRLSESRGVPTPAQPCAHKGSRAQSTAVYLGVLVPSPSRMIEPGYLPRIGEG
jgi:hypothetical protein